MMWTWNLDPVAVSLLGFDVRWYGLVYALGALVGSYVLPRIYDRLGGFPVPRKDLEDLVFFTFLCGVLGGRVGEFLFYQPGLFWSDPLEIFRVWNGGMSIHGGIMGGLGYILFWTRRHGVPFLRITDAMALVLAPILIFGRGANFMNGELWGAPTNADYGVIFPHVDAPPRHPVPLYNMLKNTLVSLGLWGLFIYKSQRQPGTYTAVFLIGYGIFRVLIEPFKVVETSAFGIPTGMIFSGIMALSGVGLLIYNHRR